MGWLGYIQDLYLSSHFFIKSQPIANPPSEETPILSLSFYLKFKMFFKN